MKGGRKMEERRKMKRGRKDQGVTCPHHPEGRKGRRKTKEDERRKEGRKADEGEQKDGRKKEEEEREER